jgi:hypothetical protein
MISLNKSSANSGNFHLADVKTSMPSETLDISLTVT